LSPFVAQFGERPATAIEQGTGLVGVGGAGHEQHGDAETRPHTSSDSTATLPANYTFTAADAGVHTFNNAVLLKKKGNQTITVTDTLNSALTATDSINVT
jgi:hypothetical protein